MPGGNLWALALTNLICMMQWGTVCVDGHQSYFGHCDWVIHESRQAALYVRGPAATARPLSAKCQASMVIYQQSNTPCQ